MDTGDEAAEAQKVTAYSKALLSSKQTKQIKLTMNRRSWEHIEVGKHNLEQPCYEWIPCLQTEAFPEGWGRSHSGLGLARDGCFLLSPHLLHLGTPIPGLPSEASAYLRPFPLPLIRVAALIGLAPRKLAFCASPPQPDHRSSFPQSP